MISGSKEKDGEGGLPVWTKSKTPLSWLQPGPIIEKSTRNCLPRTMLINLEDCSQYPGMHHINLFFQGVYQGWASDSVEQHCLYDCWKQSDSLHTDQGGVFFLQGFARNERSVTQDFCLLHFAKNFWYNENIDIVDWVGHYFYRKC